MTGCTSVTGQAGTKYTYSQLEGLWINAGGSKGLAPIMAAIAMAESGGCSAAENPTDNGGTQTSWGLWQISDGTHGQPVPNILSASVNAQQAVAKYHSQGLAAWGTYNSGAYKAYMGSATPDLNVPSSAGTITQAADTAAIEPYSASTCLLSFPGVAVPVVGNFGQFCILPKHTARAIAGFGLMTAGLFIALPGLALIALDIGVRSGIPQAVLARTPAARVTTAVIPQAPAAAPPSQPAPVRWTASRARVVRGEVVQDGPREITS